MQWKLRAIKKAGHLDQATYNKIDPTSDATPEIHQDTLKMIVFDIKSITYSLARHLANLLKPLVRKSKIHIQNSKHLSEKLVEVEIEEGEVLTSFDVIALSSPVFQAKKWLRTTGPL